MPPERFRWAKVSAAMMDNDKIVRLCDRHGPAAVLYYLASIFYAKSMDSAGQIYRRSLGHIPMPLEVSLRDRQAYVRTFLELPLWEEITSELYVIHNWHLYQSPGQDRYSASERELSTARGITSERHSGSELTLKDKSLSSPLLSREFNNRAQGTNAAAHDRGYEREAAPLVPRCPDCSMPNGFHLAECSRASPIPGTGIAPVPGTPSGERCPSCGLGWGLGHSEDCSYDPRAPLTYSDNGTSVPEVMANAPRARLLRQRLSALRPGQQETEHEA